MNKKKIIKILKKNQEDWERIAVSFSHTRQNLWLEFKDLVKYVKKGDRVLDLGCGNGRLFQILKEKEVNYLGIDQSEKLICLAKEKFPQTNFIKTNLIETFSNYCSEKLLSNEVDIIFSIALLHHLPSKGLRREFFEKCFSLLKKDGFLILTVWNFFQPRLIKKYRIRKIIFGFKNILIPFKEKEKITYRYYYAFRKRELEKIFNGAGFQIKESYYVRQGKKVGLKEGYNLVIVAKK